MCNCRKCKDRDCCDVSDCSRKVITLSHLCPPECGCNRCRKPKSRKCRDNCERKCRDPCTQQCDPCNQCNNPVLPVCRELDPCNGFLPVDRCGTRCRPKRKCGPKYYECANTRCGTAMITLSVATTPAMFSASGETILFNYTVTNTGGYTIYKTIQIFDSLLGMQNFGCVNILPGQNRLFTRSYTTTPSDVTAHQVTSVANATALIGNDRWIVTNQVTTLLTNGNADLTGTITQVVSGPDILVTVLINNSGLSLSSAENVSLTLPFPAGVVTVTPGTAVAPASAVTLSGTNVVINQASLPVSTTYQYTFTYPDVPGAYTWAGTITSTTYDPNPANNAITNTFIAV